MLHPYALALAVLVAGASAPRLSADTPPGLRAALLIRGGTLRASGQRPRGPAVPSTPKGLERCTGGLELEGPLPSGVGETIRYDLAVDSGLLGDVRVGSLDFKIERAGTLDGAAVTEYRGQLCVDPIVRTFVRASGRAAAVVPIDGDAPVEAMSRYAVDGRNFEERLALSDGGRRLRSDRSAGGKRLERGRTFPEPVRDFLTAFYALRALPRGASGCTVLYGQQKAYTVWLEPAGTGTVRIPAGRRVADRYAFRYAREHSRTIVEGEMWLSQGPERLPYKMVVRGKRPMTATVASYVPGASRAGAGEQAAR